MKGEGLKISRYDNLKILNDYYLRLGTKYDGKKLKIYYEVFRCDRERLRAGNLREYEFKTVFNPNNVEWIYVLKTPFMFSSNGCGATSFRECEKCVIRNEHDVDICGSAIVYLRVFPHKGEEFWLKIGVGADLLRPISQSSPFAIIARGVSRRDALLIESKLAKLFKKVVRNPCGRLLWSEIIKKGLWNGKEEAGFLLEALPHIYDSVERKLPEIYKKLINPLIFLPTKYFATQLPSWIERLPIRDIKKYVSREPNAVYGEVVANRGCLLVIEHGEGFWIFEPNERRIYAVEKIVGLSDILLNNHFVQRRLRLKEG